MSMLDPTGRLATEVVRDRIELRRQSRLAALARCCRPGVWRSAARAALSRVRRTVRHQGRQPAACCA